MKIPEGPDNEEQSETMSVFGERDCFHVSIIRWETDETWFWSGADPTDGQLVAIGGHFFQAHQICWDFELVRRIVRHFFHTGLPYAEAQWISNKIG